MEHRKADIRQAVAHAASGDDASRFLHELRQLRASAGLGHAELAARAHYPFDRIKAAEVGPSLPDLPVLSAYVRGCGGTTEEWEERWRSLTRTPSLPVPASRQAGRSAASDAGAKISATNQPVGAPDASIIRAALNRVAEGMASGTDELSASSEAEPATVTPAAPAPAAPVIPAPVIPAPAAPAPAVPTDDAWPQDKPSGWDPIRVSSAWPVLSPDMYKVTETDEAKGTDAPAVGAAASRKAPWASAPRATKPETGAGAGAGDVTASGPTSATAGSEAPWGPTARGGPTSAAPAPAYGATAGAGAGIGRWPARSRILVLIVVLLCVLAVLLAVFA